MSFFAHESAYIDAGAKIGDGTKIWHFCHVMPGAVIGEDCSVGQNVFVANRVTIGKGVKIQNNVSIYEGVILEDYTFCGPSMVFTNVKTPRSKFPRNTRDDYLETRVRYGASIGANATVVCGITIGEWAFVAAGAVVTKDVPDFALIAGVPGRILGWVCKCGGTLKFEQGPRPVNSTTCSYCSRTYTRESGTVVKHLEQK
jgi:UDP-2-acetamido-3-amino-2,3-dideoxy-glucuronate N-acetyltransferase